MKQMVKNKRLCENCGEETTEMFCPTCKSLTKSPKQNKSNKSVKAGPIQGKSRNESNPNWKRDEVILLMDLYVRVGYIEASHPKAIELSDLLKNSGIHEKIPNLSSFRTPGSIRMGMANLRSIDPAYDGDGLENASQLQKQVWNEFKDDKEKLHQEAESIRKKIKERDYYNQQ